MFFYIKQENENVRVPILSNRYISYMHALKCEHSEQQF